MISTKGLSKMGLISAGGGGLGGGNWGGRAGFDDGRGIGGGLYLFLVLGEVSEEEEEIAIS